MSIIIKDMSEADMLPIGSVTVADDPSGVYRYNNHTKRADGWYAKDSKVSTMNFPRIVISIPSIVAPEVDPYVGNTVTADEGDAMPEGYLLRDREGDLGETGTEEGLSIYWEPYVVVGTVEPRKRPDPDAALLERMMKADCFREEMPVYVSRLEQMRQLGIKVEMAS